MKDRMQLLVNTDFDKPQELTIKLKIAGKIQPCSSLVLSVHY